MGDIGPTQQRYDVLPLGEPSPAPVRAPVEPPPEPTFEPAPEPLVPASR